MISRDLLLRKLPPYLGNKKKLIDEQSTKDIISEMLEAHKEFSSDYDKISSLFWKGNAVATARYIFQFLKQNVKYSIEPDTHQSVKSPSAIVATGIYDDGHNDCKHYSLFAAGILDSLRRKGKSINWFYRFANYKPFVTDPGHVFVVLKDNGVEYWCDAVLPTFNMKKSFVSAIDKKVDMLYKISGINQQMQRQWRTVQNPNRGEIGLFGSRRRRKAMEAELARLRAATGQPATPNIFQATTAALNTGLAAGVAPAGTAVLPVGLPTTPYTQAYNPLYTAATQTYNFPSRVSGMGKVFLNGEEIGCMSVGRLFKKRTAEQKRLGLKANNKPKKNILLKVGLTPARNSFLGLVGLNIKHIAESLYRNLKVPGQEEKLRIKWTKLGGNYNKLKNTIMKAAAKKGLNGIGATVGFAPIAAMAAAAPIIAALKEFLGSLKGDGGEAVAADAQNAVAQVSAAAAGMPTNYVFSPSDTLPQEAMGISGITVDHIDANTDQITITDGTPAPKKNNSLLYLALTVGGIAILNKNKF